MTPSACAPLVLAVDIGSSAVRTGIYDATATSLPESVVDLPHQQTIAADGTSIEDARELAELVERAIDETLARCPPDTGRIVGVGLASMASTVLGVDRDGAPVTPIYTYADSRPGDEAERLKQQLDEARSHQSTGTSLHWSYVPPRVVWLRRTEPDVFARIDRWLDFPTYLYLRWFGGVAAPSEVSGTDDKRRVEARTSHSLAAWSGLQDRTTLDWSEELLAAIELSPDRLPRVARYADAMTGMAPGMCRRWQQLKDARFALGIGDGAAVNIGTGCVDDSRVAITVGTTAAMRVLSQHAPDGAVPQIPRGLWGYPLERGRTLIGGAFTEGGNVVKWCSDVLRMPDIAELGDALAQRTPGGHGLTVLPFLSGERAVGWATNATATFTGIRADTDALDVVQAMMEAVACRFALVADLLRPFAAPDAVYVAGGTALEQSDWWVQVVADALDAAVCTTSSGAATMRGAAIIALQTAGIWQTLCDHEPEMLARFEPRPEHVPTFRDAVERQKALYAKVV